MAGRRPPFDAAKARAGRAAMRQRCIAVALAETPDTVLWIQRRRSLSGHAQRVSRAYFFRRDPNGDTCRGGERVSGYAVASPAPVTRRALYFYLHEIGHIVLGHCDGRDRRLRAWQREQEAERFAQVRMRAHGIPVPRREIRDGRAYVERKRKQGQRAAHRHTWVDFPRGWGQHGHLERCADADCRALRPKRTGARRRR